MIETFFLVVGLIITGSLLKRSSVFPENTAEVLGSFVINVSLPAIILISIPHLPLNSEAFIPVLSHWGVYLLNVILLLGLGKLLKVKKSVQGVLLVVATMGNTAFLGIPVVESYFGKAAISYAVLYDQLGSGIVFLLTTAFILPRYTSNQKQELNKIIKNLVTFPPFVALVLGFVLMIFPLPQVINNVLEKVAQTLIPCAMITVGYQMKYRIKLNNLLVLGMTLVVKMLCLPITFVLVAKVLNMSGTALNTSVLQSGMPPMVTAGVVAIGARLEKELAAALVGYGLLFSFLSIPLIKFLLN